MWTTAYRWVKDYSSNGDIFVIKQPVIIIEEQVERIKSCDACRSIKEIGIDACLGCAGQEVCMDFDHGEVWDWDPDYPIDDGREDSINKQNKPVDPDAWAEGDLEGGY